MTARTSLAVLALCLAAWPAAGQWPSDPTVNVALCNAPGSQAGNGLVAVPSSSGAAIIAWQDDRSSDNDIYAQRVDSAGGTRWATDGIPVCTAPGSQFWLQGTGDGNGGAILVWIDLRDGEADIYAQRIDPGGNLMWPAGSPSVDGVPVCATAETQGWMQVVGDGSGGAIVTWEHGFSPNDLHAQRIDPDGNLMWPAGSPSADGVVVTDAAGVQTYSRIVSDDAGGAILVWTDGRNNSTTSYDIFAQRISASGHTLWTGDAPICVSDGAQTYPAIAADGLGGAYVAWHDQEEIRAQHVDASGMRQWADDGILLNDSSLSNSQFNLRAAGDGQGSAVVVWEDVRSYATTARDLYAQRLTPTGPVWTTGGVAISQAIGDQRAPAIESPRTGVVVIAWEDARVGSAIPDIFALEIVDGTTFSGPADGLPVSTADFGQWNPIVGTSGLGDAVLAWRDSRNLATAQDVYAQGVFLVVVFADDFETDDTSAWTVSTP